MNIYHALSLGGLILSVALGIWQVRGGGDPTITQLALSGGTIGMFGVAFAPIQTPQRHLIVVILAFVLLILAVGSVVWRAVA